MSLEVGDFIESRGEFDGAVVMKIFERGVWKTREATALLGEKGRRQIKKFLLVSAGRWRRMRSRDETRGGDEG
jgi:hypothetical protein